MEDRVSTIRSKLKEKMSPYYRSMKLRWKTTRTFKNYEAIKAYQEMYETLVNK